MFRIGCTFALFIINLTYSLAQLPTITGIDSKTGTVNTLLTITGSNFGTDKNQLKVSLGPVYAQVISATNSSITVEVPAGTTYNSISVTHLQTGLTAYSNHSFLLSFGGNDFEPNTIPGADIFPALSDLAEHCLADFDNNGLIDIATANTGSDFISVFRNDNQFTEVNFLRKDISVNAPTLSIAAEDLDGDGKKDIVTSRNLGTQIYVLRSLCTADTILFQPVIQPLFTSNTIKRITLNDVDKDGKADIIASSEAANKIFIFINTSNVGNATFNATPIEVTVAGVLGTSFITLDDLNSDGYPEIIANNLFGQDVFILTNTSSPGNISFQPAQSFSVKSGVNNMAVGDLNNDEKFDIVISNKDSVVTVLLNETEANAETIAFSDPINFETHPNAWGVDLADMDGDGDVDILVGSTSAVKKLTILNNNSAEGELLFQPIYIVAHEKSKSVKAADFNNDGKPDISYAGIDNNSIIVYQNKNCIVPAITSNYPLTVCKDVPLRIQVPFGIGVNYEWSRNNQILAGKVENYLDVTDPGDYRVKIVNSNGTCSVVSDDTTVVIVDPALATPQIEILASNAEMCTGDSILLEVNGEFAEYTWNTGEKTKSIYAKSGETYKVDVQVAGGCTVFGEKTITELPSPEITVSSDVTSITSGQKAQLTATGGVSYVWSPSVGLSDTTIANPMATPSETTVYTVVGIGENGCSNQAEITITVEETSLAVQPEKTFTPNGDSYNETWVIGNIESCPDCKVTILNRMGEKLYEAQPYNNDWNGVYNGKLLPPGDYYFLIKSSESALYKTGGFRLIR